MDVFVLLVQRKEEKSEKKKDRGSERGTHLILRRNLILHDLTPRLDRHRHQLPRSFLLFFVPAATTAGERSWFATGDGVADGEAEGEGEGDGGAHAGDEEGGTAVKTGMGEVR
jgi:hypothetical protein